MEGQVSNTLPKQERLCGKTGIDRLLARGKHGNAGPLRYIFIPDNGLDHNRLLISVPKKLFKRAVKRNLLKRRIRESWRRLQHGIESTSGMDILVMYSTKDILTYQDIYSTVENIVTKLNERLKGNSQKKENETADQQGS